MIKNDEILDVLDSRRGTLKLGWHSNHLVRSANPSPHVIQKLWYFCTKIQQSLTLAWFISSVFEGDRKASVVMTSSQRTSLAPMGEQHSLPEKDLSIGSWMGKSWPLPWRDGRAGILPCYWPGLRTFSARPLLTSIVLLPEATSF